MLPLYTVHIIPVHEHVALCGWLKRGNRGYIYVHEYLNSRSLHRTICSTCVNHSSMALHELNLVEL